MKRMIELDDFIDALVKAKELLKVAEQWEARLASFKDQETRLTASIAELTRGHLSLKASVQETTKEVAQAIQQQRDEMESALATRRAEQDRAMQEITQSVMEAARQSKAAIAKAKADELAAQDQAKTARQQLADIQSALAQAKADAKKMAVLAGS